MSFFASNNEIRINNAANVEIFNTDWKQPAITSIVSGTFNLPSRSPISGAQLILHDIGAAANTPEFVLASAKLTGAGAYPWGDTSFNSSGSVISNLGWNFVSGTWRVSGARTLTFITQSGRLYLREEYYNVFPTLALSAFSLQYKVYLGRFT